MFAHFGIKRTEPKGAFEHRAIKELIIKTIFTASKGMDCLADAFEDGESDLFNPVPLETIALATTAVRSCFASMHRILCLLVPFVQVFCALTEWTHGAYSPMRFEGEVYKHLYQRFLEHMGTMNQPGTASRKELMDTQKNIARDGLWVLSLILSCCATNGYISGRRGTRMLKFLTACHSTSYMLMALHVSTATINLLSNYDNQISLSLLFSLYTCICSDCYVSTSTLFAI